MRTAIYARFSSQLQKDSSIDDQLRICRERAVREGWQVTEVFSDYAISGAVRDRPGLNALVAHVQAGGCEQVLAESIDRLSRDQEDLAAIWKRIGFAGARIVTLSEGPIDELQIGFKGTMASLFRKDLADKIRRGQHGRVAVGRVPGNLVYGYRKVSRLDERGEPVRGLREIDPEKAEIVRRIYREYLAGDSPLTIARRLNREGVPSPSGRQWQVSAINGDSVRLNGILCNPIYAGELVYNRTRMVRDPETRRRVPRSNPPEQWQRVEMPELAIVSKADFAAVRERKAEYHDWQFARKVRPRRILSGLVACGICDGNMAIVTDGKYGCTSARTRGTCSNRRLISAAALERRVMRGLNRELLSPERVSVAVKAYHQERERLDRERHNATRHHRSRIAELEKRIARMVEAVALGGGTVPELVEQLRKDRVELAALEAAIGEAEAGNVIALHPNIAKSYHQAVERITEVLAADSEAGAEVTGALRNLVERIVLTPREGKTGMDIELQGRLAAMLDIASGKPPRARKGTVTVVAEERYGLDRTLFRIRA